VILPPLVFPDGGDHRDILAKTQRSFVARQSILFVMVKNLFGLFFSYCISASSYLQVI
jgi:hypothetical protein